MSETKIQGRLRWASHEEEAVKLLRALRPDESLPLRLIELTAEYLALFEASLRDRIARDIDQRASEWSVLSIADAVRDGMLGKVEVD